MTAICWKMETLTVYWREVEKAFMFDHVTNGWLFPLCPLGGRIALQ